MLKSIILLLVTSLTVNAFAVSVEIIGTISNAEGKTIYLNTYVNNIQVTIDSALIKKNGKFKVSANATVPNFYSISLNASNYALLILDSLTNEVEFTADAKIPFLDYYRIKGSKDSQLIRDFVSILSQQQKQKDIISQKLYSKETPLKEKEKLKLQLDSLGADFTVKRNLFIDNNYHSLAVLTTLSYLNPQTDLEYYKKIEAGLSEIVPNSEFHIAVQTQIVQIETQLKIQEEQERERLEIEKKTAIGAIAPELNFPNPNGDIITLESLRGNYVLIDFWASWCRPCRMENPNVVKLYNHYKEKGFTVYSVSLDNNKERWLGAIAQDNLSWPNHVSDLLQWKSEAVSIYGFRGIPFTVLLDKEGRIIEKNLRGPALEKKIKELLGE